MGIQSKLNEIYTHMTETNAPETPTQQPNSTSIICKKYNGEYFICVPEAFISSINNSTIDSINFDTIFDALLKASKGEIKLEGKPQSISVHKFIADEVRGILIPNRLNGIDIDSFKVRETQLSGSMHQKFKEQFGADCNIFEHILFQIGMHCVLGTLFKGIAKQLNFKTIDFSLTDVEEINDSLFEESTIERVILSKKTHVIQRRAFFRSSVKEVLGDSICTVGQFAFHGCKLDKIDIKPTHIYKHAFDNASFDTIDLSETQFISEDAFAFANIGTLRLSEKITSFGRQDGANIHRIDFPRKGFEFGIWEMLHIGTVYGVYHDTPAECIAVNSGKKVEYLDKKDTAVEREYARIYNIHAKEKLLGTYEDGAILSMIDDYIEVKIGDRDFACSDTESKLSEVYISQLNEAFIEQYKDLFKTHRVSTEHNFDGFKQVYDKRYTAWVELLAHCSNQSCIKEMMSNSGYTDILDAEVLMHNINEFVVQFELEDDIQIIVATHADHVEYAVRIDKDYIDSLDDSVGIFFDDLQYELQSVVLDNDVYCGLHEELLKPSTVISVQINGIRGGFACDGGMYDRNSYGFEGIPSGLAACGIYVPYESGWFIIPHLNKAIKVKTYKKPEMLVIEDEDTVANLMSRLKADRFKL